MISQTKGRVGRDLYTGRRSGNPGIAYGTEEEVRRQVRERIDVLGPGGGFF